LVHSTGSRPVSSGAELVDARSRAVLVVAGSADAVNECSCQRTGVVFVREIGTRSGSGLTTPRSPTPRICHWGVLADAGSPQFEPAWNRWRVLLGRGGFVVAVC